MLCCAIVMRLPAAKKLLPLMSCQGKGQDTNRGNGNKKGATEQRTAAEPKRPLGRPTNAKRQHRAATTTGLPRSINEASDDATAGLTADTCPHPVPMHQPIYFSVI